MRGAEKIVELAPLKVLLVSPKPPPNGGIGRWTILLLRWLDGQQGVELRHVDISPRWRAVDDLRLFKRLTGGGVQGLRDGWRVLVQLVWFQPDVLHLTTSGSLAGVRDLAVLGLARFFPARTVYHIRIGRVPELVSTSGWEWRLLHLAMRLADKVVVIEQASQMALKSILPPEKVLRLPNAIDLKGLEQSRKQKAEGRNENGPVVRRVLYLGWVIPTKGMRELMEAWHELSPQGWELVVAGPGSEAYRQELAGIAGCGDSVRFLGEVSPRDGWLQMQRADIFVLPTYTEGFPNVILEAMAAGKAIIATSVGAIPEMLQAASEDPCGVVIEPRNVPALVRALRLVMAEEPLCTALGQRARAKVERCYSADAVFARLLALWRQLGEGADRRGAVSR